MIRCFKNFIAACAALSCLNGAAAASETALRARLEDELARMTPPASLALRGDDFSGACAIVAPADDGDRAAEAAARRARALALGELVALCAQHIPAASRVPAGEQDALKDELMSVRKFSARLGRECSVTTGRRGSARWAVAVMPTAKLLAGEREAASVSQGELDELYTAHLARLGDEAVAAGDTKAAERHYTRAVEFSGGTADSEVFIALARAAAANGRLAAARQILGVLSSGRGATLTADQKRRIAALQKIIDDRLPRPAGKLVPDDE